MSFFSRLFEKQSAVAAAVAQQFGVGSAKMTPRRYDTLADEGYIKNVIAFRCISLIAESASSVPWAVYRGDEVIEDHALNKLVEKPNATSGISDIIEHLLSYYLIAGNAYLERTTDGRNEPLEIYALRPDRMKVAMRKNGLPAYYEYTVGENKVRYEADPITGEADVYHMKHFHPLNDFYGMAPIEASAYAIDQHNFAGQHNAALLQNGATPSSLLIHKAKIAQDMIDKAEKKLAEKYAGTKNAGKTMVLGGDWDLVKMGQTMKELDFNKGKLDLAREICAGFGVPHILVVNGETTYNNLAESRLFLWEERVIPLLTQVMNGAMKWLAAPYEGYSIRPVYDDVPALSIKRERSRRLYRDLYIDGIISKNEARRELGFEDVATDRFNGESVDSSEGKSINLLKKNDEALLKTVSDEIDRPEIHAEVSSLIGSELDKLVAEYGAAIVQEIGLRSSFEVTDAVVNFSKDTTAELISNVNRTTRRLIREEIEEAFLNRETYSQIRVRINDVFKGQIAAVRVARIAETEVTRLTGFAGVEAILQAGLSQKEWVSTLDGSTRDTHSALDGQRASTSGKFRTIDGNEAEHPGGFGIASEDINCRCAVVAVMPEKSDSAEDRKTLWDKREKQRAPLDKSFMETSAKMFTMQAEVVLKRFGELTGDAE